MDEAAIKRAAAAEARRQKILARGTERLNRITVGTPLVSDDSAPQGPEAPASEGSGPQQMGSATGLNAAASPSVPAASVSDSATRDVPPDAALALDSRRAPMAPGSGVGILGEERTGGSVEDEAAEAVAQEEAQDQALHALLNQLAGAAAQLEREQLRAAAAAGGDTGRAAQARSAPASSGPAPLSPPLPPPPSALSPLVAAVGSLLGPLLGPQLSAAVEGTRRLRLCVAVALAAVLFWGALDVGAMAVPPLLALLAAQAALIAGARVVLGRTPSRLRLSKSTSGLDLLGGAAAGGGAGDGDDDDPTAAAAATAAFPTPPSPLPPRGFDWLSLAPGLRPLLDRAASAVALVSGLTADVSVFLTAYVLLGAARQLAGR